MTSPKVYDDNKIPHDGKTVTKALQDYLFLQRVEEGMEETKASVRELVKPAVATTTATAHTNSIDFTPALTTSYTGLDGYHPHLGGSTPIPPVPEQKKDTNPKDAVGIRKVAFSTVPQTVVAEIGVGMMEGARKYGRHNWRAAEARASVYFDATLRHLYKWYEGEDIDPDSGLSHISKAITSLVVLRDAMINDKWNDDRPPKIPTDFWNGIQDHVDEIFVKYPTALDPVTEWSVRNSFPGDKS